MKHFWALPAFLRPALVLASQLAFSVHDDLLAFPQYDVKFPQDYVSESQAQSRLESPGAQPSVDASSDVGQYESHEDSQDADSKDTKVSYEMMILDKQRYLCSIPIVAKPADQSSENATLTKAEQDRELARANERGWELLSAMQGHCVYFVSGWWSYRFCYNEGVRQFHQLPPSKGMPPYPPVEDKGVEGYMLGKYDPKKGDAGKESEWEGDGALEVSQGSKPKKSSRGELVTRGESRYLVQRMEGGTTCDLTGKPRRIEVQFHCNPSTGSDRISLIKETSTCAYLMVIQTPRLCNDVAFLPPQKDAANGISCSPILAPAEAATYTENLKAAKIATKEAEVWESDPEAAAIFGMEHVLDSSSIKVVGDIVVGGHAIVPEDMKIEKSAIVGGGKETYIDTVANSDGRMLTKEQLEKMGLGDPKAVEKLKKELEKLADGDSWKLDVIDTPRGREYRGIIGTDEDGDEGKKDGKTTQGGDESGEAETKEGEGSEEEFYKEEL